jgi:hypothetical protein
MNRLSEEERVLGLDVSASMPGRWYAEEVVEAIVAARLASVKALIETLPRNEFGDEHYLAVEAAYANAIAALGSDAHTEPKGAGDESGHGDHTDPYCATHCLPGVKVSQCGCTRSHKAPR